MRILSLSAALLVSLTALPLRADVQTYCSTAPNSVGPGAILDWFGPSNPQFGSLLVAGAPADVPAMFVYGLASQQVPFGDGYSCIAGANWILARRTTDAQGALSLRIWGEGEGEDLQWLTHPQNWGATWYFQALYRDPLGPLGSGLNATQGLAVEFTP